MGARGIAQAGRVNTRAAVSPTALGNGFPVPGRYT